MTCAGGSARGDQSGARGGEAREARGLRGGVRRGGGEARRWLARRRLTHQIGGALGLARAVEEAVALLGRLAEHTGAALSAELEEDRLAEHLADEGVIIDGEDERARAAEVRRERKSLARPFAVDEGAARAAAVAAVCAVRRLAGHVGRSGVAREHKVLHRVDVLHDGGPRRVGGGGILRLCARAAVTVGVASSGRGGGRGRRGGRARVRRDEGAAARDRGGAADGFDVETISGGPPLSVRRHATRVRAVDMQGHVDRDVQGALRVGGGGGGGVGGGGVGGGPLSGTEGGRGVEAEAEGDWAEGGGRIAEGRRRRRGALAAVGAVQPDVQVQPLAVAVPATAAVARRPWLGGGGARGGGRGARRRGFRVGLAAAGGQRVLTAGRKHDVGAFGSQGPRVRVGLLEAEQQDVGVDDEPARQLVRLDSHLRALAAEAVERGVHVGEQRGRAAGTTLQLQQELAHVDPLSVLQQHVEHGREPLVHPLRHAARQHDARRRHRRGGPPGGGDGALGVGGGLAVAHRRASRRLASRHRAPRLHAHGSARVHPQLRLHSLEQVARGGRLVAEDVVEARVAERLGGRVREALLPPRVLLPLAALEHAPAQEAGRDAQDHLGHARDAQRHGGRPGVDGSGSGGGVAKAAPRQQREPEPERARPRVRPCAHEHEPRTLMAGRQLTVHRRRKRRQGNQARADEKLLAEDCRALRVG